jgi:hypothetical protein
VALSNMHSEGATGFASANAGSIECTRWIDSFSAQSTSRGILVEIPDRMNDRFFWEEIAVVAGSFLPKSKTTFPRPLSNGELLNKLRAILDQDFLDQFGKGCLMRAGYFPKSGITSVG